MKLWQILQQYDIGTEEQKKAIFRKKDGAFSKFLFLREGKLRQTFRLGDKTGRPAHLMQGHCTDDVWEPVE